MSAPGTNRPPRDGPRTAEPVIKTKPAIDEIRANEAADKRAGPRSPHGRRWPGSVARARHEEFRSLWDYPFLACRAVGGTEEQAYPAPPPSSAHGERPPRRRHSRRRAPGGLPHLGRRPRREPRPRLPGRRPLRARRRRPGRRDLGLPQIQLARIAFATAFGQAMDGLGLRSRGATGASSTPRRRPCSAARSTWARRLGGAARTSPGARPAGPVLGMFIQVTTISPTPWRSRAEPTGTRPINNLPILYALTAEHGEREEFGRLVTRPATTGPPSPRRSASCCGAAPSAIAPQADPVPRQARQLLAACRSTTPPRSSTCSPFR